MLIQNYLLAWDWIDGAYLLYILFTLAINHLTTINIYIYKIQIFAFEYKDTQETSKAINVHVNNVKEENVVSVLPNWLLSVFVFVAYGQTTQ